MEHEFPLGLFRAEKQDYLFKCSGCPEKFPLERPKWSCSIYFPTGFSGNVLLMVNNHGLPRSRLWQKWLREGLQSTALNFPFEFRKIDLTVNPPSRPEFSKFLAKCKSPPGSKSRPLEHSPGAPVSTQHTPSSQALPQVGQLGSSIPFSQAKFSLDPVIRAVSSVNPPSRIYV